MSIAQLDNTPRCQHVFLSGRACKAPARRGTSWCLFHAAEHNEAPLPFSTLDDAAGVHAAAGQVLFDLQRDVIDPRRASLMLSGLRLMRANLKQLAVELGDPQPEPRKLTKQERKEAELESMPSLAEILLTRLNELSAEDAREEGRPAPSPIDVAAAAASDEDLPLLLLRHMRALEESGSADDAATDSATATETETETTPARSACE